MRQMRARRAREREHAAATGPDGAQLRDADDLLAPAVQDSIAALELGDQDQGAAALTLRYAQIIDAAPDQAWAARWLMPLLLDAVAELGATPAARAKQGKRKPPERPGPNWLEQMRQNRPPEQ